jgi:hypothetical protein
MNIILPNISNNAKNNGIKRFIYTNNNIVNCEITEVGVLKTKNILFVSNKGMKFFENSKKFRL